MKNNPFYKGKCVQDEHNFILADLQQTRVKIINDARDFRKDRSMYDANSSAVYHHCMALDREIQRHDFPNAEIPTDNGSDDNDDQVSTQCL